MKLKKMIGFGFLAVGLMVFGGFKLGHAEGLKVSGYASTIYHFIAEDGMGNTSERTFTLDGELDVAYQQNGFSTRMDLDIPSSGKEAIGFSVAGDLGIEQARFDWVLPVGGQFGLTMTGGAFNSPIGFEAQDAPDMLQTSHGQLFNLVPSNLLGVMVSGGVDMVSGSVFAGNEWRGTAVGDENTIGGIVTVTPMDKVSVSAGALLLPDKKSSVAGGGDKDVVNVVAQTTLVPMTLLAAEFTKDSNNTGFGLVANVHHGNEMPHFATLRYDHVAVDVGSEYPALLGAPNTVEWTIQSLTLAGGVEVAENLAIVLELRRDMVDDDTNGTDLEFDSVTIEWVATF